jgi:3-isopropylmalate/(R)-2-methylmalate dehydratase small subunit
MSENIIKGKVFVVGDNIDTDQIIPAQYLNLVPTIPEEYKKLGSYALCGLPDEYTTRYVEDGKFETEYPIIIGAKNFGCGSSREHAPISLGAAGCKAVIANSFARIFFRNCIATGEVYPIETDEELSDIVKTGDEIEIALEENSIKNITTGKTHSLKSLGDVKEVIDSGGIFEYARKSGMIN